jgi:hypothetical protein
MADGIVLGVDDDSCNLREYRGWECYILIAIHLSYSDLISGKELNANERTGEGTNKDH